MTSHSMTFCPLFCPHSLLSLSPPLFVLPGIYSMPYIDWSVDFPLFLSKQTRIHPHLQIRCHGIRILQVTTLSLTNMKKVLQLLTYTDSKCYWSTMLIPTDFRSVQLLIIHIMFELKSPTFTAVHRNTMTTTLTSCVFSNISIETLILCSLPVPTSFA